MEIKSVDCRVATEFMNLNGIFHTINCINYITITPIV